MALYEASLLSQSKRLSEKEKASTVFRRSLFAVKDIKEGEYFSEENVRSIRPSNGVSPKYYNEILGKKAATDIGFGEPLSWEKIEKK